MLRVIIYLGLLLMTGCVQQHQPIIKSSLYSLNNNQQHSSDIATTSNSLGSELENKQTNSLDPAKYAVFTGIATLTALQRTIRLCHNEQVFNLLPNQDLLDQIKRLNKDKVYIEFKGQMNQSLTPAHQRPVINIQQLHYLTPENPNSCKTNLVTTTFQVAGSEPNWFGYAKGNELTFIIKDLNSKWAIKKSVITKDIRAFVETENSHGEQLNISFSGQGCIDNSNNYWQYQTKLYLKNKQIKGCGKYPNQPDETTDWFGSYRYKNNNVTIELSLLKHHQANIKYSYPNGKKRYETGYWHLYGSSGLKLLLTQHQGNKANIVFHFRRDGVRLQATKQWRDNQKYSFNGAILTLDRMTDDVETESVINIEENIIERTFQAESIPSPSISTPAINNVIKRYFSMHKTKTDNTKYWFSEYDLNGDDHKDLLVMLDWCEADGCILLVFENKNGDYRFISRITQAQSPIQVSRAQHHRWQSLLIRKNEEWRQLDFNGINYPTQVSKGIAANKDLFTQIQLISNKLTSNNAIQIQAK